MLLVALLSLTLALSDGSPTLAKGQDDAPEAKTAQQVALDARGAKYLHELTRQVRAGARYRFVMRCDDKASARCTRKVKGFLSGLAFPVGYEISYVPCYPEDRAGCVAIVFDQGICHTVLEIDGRLDLARPKIRSVGMGFGCNTVDPPTVPAPTSPRA
jgi:hypothetical protein